MKSDDPISRDRIAELEYRIGELEADTIRLRALLKGKISTPRAFFRDKFGPKMEDYHHYSPRPLWVPSDYAQTAIPQPAPKIAIVSPSLNQGRFIGATIDSVLNQNYPALKYHVQDAGSSDNTFDVLKSYGDRLSWNSAPDRGHGHAINRGFGVVAGDIMAYLNTDDLLMPGTLAYVARAFAANPDIDVVYGHRICIDRVGKEIGRWVLPQHDAKSIKWFDFIPQETMFWRKRAWDAVGGLDESFQFAVDWDFILRAQAKGMRFLRLPRFLGCFRIHGTQKSSLIDSVGQEESRRLRRAHLGFDPDPWTVEKGKIPHLRRHVLYHRLYKLKLVRY